MKKPHLLTNSLKRAEPPKKNDWPKMLLLIAFALLLALLLNSCALAPPDVPVCTEITMTKGWCTNTISDTEFYIDNERLFNGKSWWELRPTMIQVPVDSWVAMKAYIIKACKKYGNCDKDIAKWERKVEVIDKQLDQKAPKPSSGLREARTFFLQNP